MGEGTSLRASIRLCEAHAEREPGNLPLHLQLAELYALDGRLAEAEAGFRACLEHEPDQGRAWVGLGLVQLHAGQPQQAAGSLGRAAAVWPRHATVRVALGWALICSKHIDAAQAAFEQALQVEPRCAEAHGGLAAVLALKHEVAASAKAARRARRLKPDCFGASFAQGAIETLKGQAEVAKRTFVHLLRDAPGDSAHGALAHTLRGWISPPAGDPASFESGHRHGNTLH